MSDNPKYATGDPIEVIHHEGYDPDINTPFVPAIRANGFLFISGVTGAPVYHDHPHRAEDFDSMPLDAEGQARIAFEHLDQALTAGGSRRTNVCYVTRFLTDVDADQDVINRLQGEFFGSFSPTSATVEVTRLATDPRLRLEIQVIAAVGDEDAVVRYP